MKTAARLAFASALLAAAGAVEYTVSSCADIAAVDDTTVTSLIITASPIECEEYTRFPVRNSMTVGATVSEVVFSNFSFKVLGSLIVDPDVTFMDVVEQVKNGGALSVAEGASATFMGTAAFSDNSVTLKQIGPISCGEGCTRIGRGLSYIVKKGGAIHNKGELTFEKDATFERNLVVTDDSNESGRAGAISNAGMGTITFKGKLTIADSEAEGFFDGLGGAIFNRGTIVVEGESMFSGCRASDGGVIYQTKIGEFTFNGFATFTENGAFELRGGAVFNDGGVMNFNGGSLFHDNFADGSGDGGLGGAIANLSGGVITLTGSTTFSENSAYIGGAIYNRVDEDDPSLTTTTFPDDTVFMDNTASECPDVYTSGDECPVTRA